MSFTLTDKTLLDRAARLINEQASGLRLAHGQVGWSTDDASRKAKLVYDRLLRDERDLRALGRRLAKHFDVRPAPRAPKEKKDPPAPEAVQTGLPLPVETVVDRLTAGNPELPMVLQHDDDLADPVCPECGQRDVAMCASTTCPAHTGVAHG